MKELREYQQEIVNRVLASNKDSLVVLPTGGGKTVIATSIMQGLDCTVVFVVPRLELIKQASKEFADLGDVDVVWADKTKITGSKYIIASKDSLRTQLDRLPKEFIMIIDEVHVSIEQSYNLVTNLNPKRVIGLTATPERMDGKALLKGTDNVHKFGLFDEVIASETVPSLIKKGYLSPLHYYAKPIEGITDIKPDNKLAEELSDAQMCQIFTENEIWGDLVKSYEEYGKGRPALGFTTTIAMANQVAELFQNAGYKFEVIHGEMSISERQSLIHALETREIDGLVNAALLTYGFDCPCVSYAFSCRHIKSRPLWFQIIGRILRICEGKEDAIFVDHGDSISEFSEPDCSLPIMDPFIKWRIDGENKEARAERRKGLKKVQDTMRLIQELDPLPANMIEVTMEDTWERLVRIITRQRDDIKKLEKEKQDINRQKDKLIEYQAKLREQQKQLEADILEKKRELENVSFIAKTAEQKVKQLNQENTNLRQQVTIEKRVLSRDETFEFIRTRYPKLRDMGLVHSQVVSKLKEEFAEDKLQYDFVQFNKSIHWWEEHYKEKNNYENTTTCGWFRP